jgi:DNA-binding NtrC family response regulator
LARELSDIPEMLPEFLGDCPEISELRRQVSRLLTRPGVSGRLPPILILGETGTGKGLLARCIHRASPRQERAFIDVDCAAIPDTLLEAELFGFERGAFTDAKLAKPGLFQSAHLGTIFLDEVGLMPRPLQSKLLKVVEQREVRRLGSTRNTPLDVCIISATNEQLATATSEGRFREDLYHRLSAVTLHLPPLRDRGADILLLAERFIARACLEYGLPQKRLTSDAREAILAYRWPGNLRELLNVADRVTLLSDEPVITAARLDLPMGGPRSGRFLDDAPSQPESSGMLGRAELLEVLEGAGWRLAVAASRLGVPRNTLRYRLEKLGISLERSRRERAGQVVAEQTALAATSRVDEGRVPRRVVALRVALDGLPDDVSEPSDDPLGEPAPAPGRLIDRIAARLRSFGARILVVGDAQVSAVFGLDPGEDATGRAALASLSIRDTAVRLAPREGKGISVRTAIHADTVLACTHDGVMSVVEPDTRRLDAQLDTVLTFAEHGGIAVSDAAALRLDRRFMLVPIAAASSFHRLLAPRAVSESDGRVLTPFVGREDKVNTLLHLFAEVERGHGQVVGVVGEPGIGKSRLLSELRLRLAGQPYVWRQGRYLPDGGALPFQPAVDILRDSFALGHDDHPEAVAEKVSARLQGMGLDPATVSPLILAFLGDRDASRALRAVRPDDLKAQIFEVLIRLAIERSLHAPLILVVEDLQWSPPVAAEFLRALVGVVSGARIMLLCTYRPEYQPTWLGHSYVTQLALQPLSREDSVAVVRSHPAGRDLSDRLENRLLDRGEGNPFFLEELAAASSQHVVTESTVPATIEAVIVGRVESLPEALCRVLHVAAVAGQEVPLRVLQDVIGGAASDLDSRLEHLARLEFIRPVLRAGERAYLFKHTLTRHVIYQSLTAWTRQSLHRAIAEALERLNAGGAESAIERLAYHYANGHVPLKAVQYLRHAAARAGRRNEPAQAVMALRQGLIQARRLSSGPERDGTILDLATRQMQPLALLGRLTEARDELSLYRHLVKHVDDAGVIGRFHAALGSVYGRLGDDRQGSIHLDIALQYALRSGDDKTLARAHLMLSQSRFWSGDFSRGIWHGLESASLFERMRQPWRVGRSMVYVAWNQASLGDVGQARASADRVQELARESDEDTLLLSAGSICRAWVSGMSGRSEEAIAAGRLALEAARGPSNRAFALSFLGSAHLEADDAASAAPALEEAAIRLGEFGFIRLSGLASAWLGEAVLLLGDVDRAEAMVLGSVAQMGRIGCPFVAAWGERTLGRVAQARGRLDEADMRLGRAQDGFDRLSARYEAARTLLARASVACDAGRRSAADNLVGAAGPAFDAMRLPAYLSEARTLARRFAGDALAT